MTILSRIRAIKARTWNVKAVFVGDDRCEGMWSVSGPNLARNVEVRVTDAPDLSKALEIAVEGLEKLYAGERLADSKSALYKPFLSKKAEAFVFSALAAIEKEFEGGVK